MYAEKFQKSLAAVEAAREKNTAYEPARMTAQQKEELLAAFHPDYKQEEFTVLAAGDNKGDKVRTQLAELLQGKSRISAADVDLNAPDYDTDVLIIGGTSLTVYPAASFVNYFQGNSLVVINMEKTQSDAKADLVFHDKIGNVMSALIKELEK